MNQVYNYVGGNFCALNQKSFIKYNPCTEEAIANCIDSNQQSTNHAIAAARNAQKSWRSISRIKRAEYFDRLIDCLVLHREEITKTICLETGKNRNEANAEFNESVHMVQYTFAQGREPYGTLVASEIADKDINVFRKPKGVVGVIAPFNFPLAISFWTCAPALLEGNTVVFKPSEDAPMTGDLIAKLYHEAGFPAGVFNAIHGTGETGKYLVEGDVDHICFTGSAKVGKLIRQHCATTWHKSCSCEMGSKSAVILFDDAPSNIAVDACLNSVFKLAGQRCVSASRLLVQSKIYEDFCERFVEEVKKIKIGNPFKEETGGFDNSIFYGPIINKKQFEQVHRYNEMTLGKTHILLKGERISDKGFFLSPHVYTSNWEHAHEEGHEFLREEVFGPHVAIIPFNDAEDAVRIYNDTIYGLSLAVLTKNMSTARYMRENCNYGMGYHNLPTIGSASHSPFSGIGASGSGGGSAAGTFKTVTHEVTWTTNFDPNGFQMEQGLK